MADRSWYVALHGNREGPFTDAQFRERIGRGEVNTETLVWNASMTAWTKAGDVPGLLTPGAGQALALGGAPGAALSPAGIPTWGLFGRSLLVAICQFLIIPSPWAVTAFYRWFVARIQVPNGKQVTF